MPDLAAGNQVLELAVRMEEIARDFYEALGLASDDPKVRQFCLETSHQEAMHRTTFQTLREQWSRSDQATLMPPEAMEALAAMVKQQTLPSPDEVRSVALKGDLGRAVRLAMDMERDSIRVYEGMRRSLPHLVKTLDTVLAEEHRHVGWLQALANTM